MLSKPLNRTEFKAISENVVSFVPGVTHTREQVALLRKKLGDAPWELIWILGAPYTYNQHDITIAFELLDAFRCLALSCWGFCALLRLP